MLELAEERQIVDGLKQGDSGAFRALYDSQGRAILSYLTRLTSRKELAEELTQETFLTAIRKIGFFRTDRDAGLRAWLFRIATHLAIDVLRREKRMELSCTEDGQVGDLVIDDRAGAEEKLEQFQFSHALALALQQLSSSQRMIFLLREQEGMSLLEISRICGCSENAIKQSLFRSRATLRKKLCE